MLRNLMLTTTSVIIVTLAGCGGGGGSERPQFSVTGKVTFNGNPVNEGIVQFEDTATGLAGSAILGDGGTYSTELPEANYKVSITPPMIEMPATPNSPGDTVPKEVDNIPNQYRSFDTSGFAASVAAGTTEHNFDMQP